MLESILNSIGLIILAIGVLFNSRTIYKSIKAQDKMNQAVTTALVTHEARLKKLEAPYP